MQETRRKLIKKSFTPADWLGRISRILDKLLARLDQPFVTDVKKNLGLRTAQYSIGTKAQIIANENPNRQRLVVKNVNSVAGSVAIGEDLLTSTTGYLLNQNEREEILNSSGPIWAIASSGTISVTVLEE